MSYRKLVIASLLFFMNIQASSTIAIVPAAAEDYKCIAMLHHASWHATFDAMLPEAYRAQQTRSYLENYWQDYFKKDLSQEVFLVAKKDNVIVGFIAAGPISESSEKTASYSSEIYKLYVDTRCQGLGIGSQLMKACLEKLHELGHFTAIVRVFDKNTQAQKFYEKCGGLFIAQESFNDYHGPLTAHIYGFKIHPKIEYEIRLATAADLIKCGNLVREIYEGYYTTIGVWSDEKCNKVINEIMTYSDLGVLLVACDMENNLLGLIWAFPFHALEGNEKDFSQQISEPCDADVTWWQTKNFDNTAIIIKRMYVTEWARGKGIGKKLLHAAISAFPRARKVYSDPFWENQAALGFYKRLGFHERIHFNVGQPNETVLIELDVKNVK